MLYLVSIYNYYSKYLLDHRTCKCTYRHIEICGIRLVYIDQDPKEEMNHRIKKMFSNRFCTDKGFRLIILMEPILYIVKLEYLK